MPYWKTILIAAIILYASLIREPQIILTTVEHGDKWSHLLAYTLLGTAAWHDTIRHTVRRWIRLFIALLLPIAYGGAIEIAQHLWFYPRTGDWIDWIVDCIGVFIGCFIAHLIPSTINSNINNDSGMA
jgi:VanZ family protein